MIVIATDEAGYGPKLGPLVVAASMWEVDAEHREDLGNAFGVLSQPVAFQNVSVVVDDSKSVFQSKSKSGSESNGFRVLESVVMAGCHWCGKSNTSHDLIGALAAPDADSLRSTPWLAALVESPMETEDYEPLAAKWNDSNIRLLDLETRIVTASEFNRCCQRGANKSDLLSRTTLELVDKLIRRIDFTDRPAVEVYCDRHGGRRYYAGPLQSVFDGSLVQVHTESKTESAYCVPNDGDTFSIRFTVKGDRFPPVAFSSMVAKYLRERAMNCLNEYFAARHHSGSAFRATAGYPVDADRFLDEVAPVLKAESIQAKDFIRSR